jgi:hypothetical protein
LCEEIFRCRAKRLIRSVSGSKSNNNNTGHFDFGPDPDFDPDETHYFGLMRMKNPNAIALLKTFAIVA